MYWWLCSSSYRSSFPPAHLLPSTIAARHHIHLAQSCRSLQCIPYPHRHPSMYTS
ncbi:hypothetical protein BDZ45DRAFT_761765 [Acephala macrosclerotiorum]|nr:hypothetical protein BDZ45DRAFT_761765 [Acephala macrosclerotiorum]